MDPIIRAYLSRPAARFYVGAQLDFSRGINGRVFLPMRGTVPTVTPARVPAGIPSQTAVAVGSGVMILASVMTQAAIEAQTRAVDDSPDQDVEEDLSRLVEAVLDVETQVEAKRKTRVAKKTMKAAPGPRFNIRAYSRRAA